ncbi:MAG: cytidine deaminase [Prevotella sp.]|nr:cytidine deaminase [Prevotella sp.]
MKEIDITIKIKLCNPQELTADDRELVERAIKATENAYAPYSHFYVGAAIRLQDGTIFTGANQENAAFTSGTCAERATLFAAQSQRPDQPLSTIAIAARNAAGLLKQPIPPCGQCRQALLEMEDRYKKPLRLLLYGTEGIYVINSVKDILPLTFVGDTMK